MTEPTAAPRRTRRLYLVEAFWPGVTSALAADAAARLRAAASSEADGSPVRHLSSTLLPADEVVLTFVEAASVRDVRAMSERAAVAADRISESVVIEPRIGSGE